MILLTARWAPHTGYDLTPQALMQKVFEDHDLAARRDKVMGELFGFDLFDIAKNTSLPAALIDPLTWSPGEDTVFFAPGDFSGWPLRIWPIMKRPFIRLHGKSFCFDIFSLFDNLYRSLRRLIVQLEPSYSNTWNDRQKTATEELPFTYLARILPGQSSIARSTTDGRQVADLRSGMRPTASSSTRTIYLSWK